jgi:hypothetical protein
LRLRATPSQASPPRWMRAALTRRSPVRRAAAPAPAPAASERRDRAAGRRRAQAGHSWWERFQRAAGPGPLSAACEHPFQHAVASLAPAAYNPPAPRRLRSAQLAAAAAAGAALEIFDVRVLPDSGLMYVSSKPLTSAPAPRRVVTSSEAAAPGGGELSHAGRPGSGPAGGARAQGAGAGDGGGGARAAPVPARRGARRGGRGIRRSDWQELTSLQPYPFTAVGLIESKLSPSMAAKCRWGGAGAWGGVSVLWWGEWGWRL